MGSDIILCMALIASFAFVIQFLLSILGSDLDTDIDIDDASDCGRHGLRAIEMVHGRCF